MTGLLRRLYPRYDTENDVVMEIKDSDNGGKLPGEVKGVMRNIGQGGCNVVVYTPMIGGDHLFFKALNSDRYHLHLTVNLKEKGELNLDARPVWMDSCVYKERPAFTIGMQFLQKQRDLSCFHPG